MSVLSEIVEDVRRRVKKEKEANPLDVEKIDRSKGRSLRESIESNSAKVSVIAELKKASPSMGEIRSGLSPARLAKAMARGGAAGVSVLTEPEYFGGRPKFLKEAREAVRLPVLRKDFIVDKYQLHQSAQLGADAVLLISEVLGKEITEFVDIARDLGMEPFVEVRNEEQAELARFSEANLIGINNRDLETLEVDISRTEQLLEYLPDDSVSVSESGIKTRNDVERILEAGADAVLVGTAIMESEDVEDKVRSLVSGGS